MLVFNGNVILGTTARKIRSKSVDAFASIDYPKVAIVQDKHVIHYITNLSTKTKFYENLSNDVALLKLTPGVYENVLEFLLEHHKVVVIESFGVGGLPDYEGNKYNELISKYTKLGRVIVMTTQVPNEGSDIAIYQVGHYLKENENVLEAYDMTTEAVITKMMWILSITNKPSKIKKMFYTTIANDILFRRDI